MPRRTDRYDHRSPRLAGLLISITLAATVAGLATGASSPRAFAAVPLGNNFSDTFDGGSASWKPYSGTWSVEDGEFSQASTGGGSNHATLIGKRFGDATYEVDLRAVNAAEGSWAGVQFKKMRPEDHPFDSGYTVYLRPNGSVELYRVNKVLAASSTGVNTASMNRLRVVTSGASIKVFINGESSPRININDATFASGHFGLVAFSSRWHFDDIQITAETLPYTIDLGNEEVLYTDPQMPISMDQSFATLRKDDGTLYYDMVHPGASGLTRFEGAPDRPLTTQVFNKTGMTFIDLNGHNAGYGVYEVWMPNYYRIGPNELIAFTHNEKYPTGEPRGLPMFTMGIAYSTNNGASWEFCGEILSPKHPRLNVGGSAYVVVGDSFYLYYNEGDRSTHSDPWPRSVGVAKAKITDVVAAARSHSVSPWLKYKDGAFTENALTGMGSPIIENTYVTEDAHSDATYSTALGKYLLTVQTEYAAKLTLYSSADGIHWSMEALVDVMPNGAYMQPYSSFVDIEGGSIDGSVVDDDFYIMYERKPLGDFFNDTLMRKQVTITLNTDDRYVAASGFSANQGANRWTYEERSGTTYSAMSWDAAESRWHGASTYALIGGAWQHPDATDSVRTWTAPKAGTVRVTGTPKKADHVLCGDGVNVAIYKNTTQVWPATGWATIAATNTAGAPHDLSMSVAAGDKIRFVVNRNQSISCDATHWDPLVQYDAWSAAGGFSGAQGANQWSYYQAYGGTYTPMSWDSANGRWQGSSTYALIGADWQHPDETDALRYWTAPRAGTVRITGVVRMQGPTFAGDGIKFKIMRNGTQIYPTSGLFQINYNDATGRGHDVSTNVAAGDRIYFLVNRNGTNSGDTTMWNPVIQYTTP